MQSQGARRMQKSEAETKGEVGAGVYLSSDVAPDTREAHITVYINYSVCTISLAMTTYWALAEHSTFPKTKDK